MLSVKLQTSVSLQPSNHLSVSLQPNVSLQPGNQPSVSQASATVSLQPSRGLSLAPIAIQQPSMVIIQDQDGGGNQRQLQENQTTMTTDVASNPDPKDPTSHYPRTPEPPPSTTRPWPKTIVIGPSPIFNPQHLSVAPSPPSVSDSPVRPCTFPGEQRQRPLEEVEHLAPR